LSYDSWASLPAKTIQGSTDHVIRVL
jgi:hypothetical protein